MLFDVTFNPFKVVLQQPVYSVEDYSSLKSHTKRVLLEIRDTYGSESVNIAWSGGHDTAFIALCYNELVEEGTLPPSTFSFCTARFVDNDKPASVEWERGMIFYKKYIDPRIVLHIHDVNVNDKPFIQKSCLLIKEIKRPTLACLIQEQWRRDIGGHFIVGIGFPWHETTNNLFIANSSYFWHHIPSSPCVNVFDWDADIWSSFITPFYLKFPAVPYNESFHFNGHIWENIKPKNIQYMLCFPQLFELFFKHKTIIQGKHFLRYQSYLPVNFKHYKWKLPVVLPNDEKVTTVEQTQEFFNGHS